MLKLCAKPMEKGIEDTEEMACSEMLDPCDFFEPSIKPFAAGPFFSILAALFHEFGAEFEPHFVKVSVAVHVVVGLELFLLLPQFVSLLG